MKTDWPKLAAAVLLCESTGIVASLATISAVPAWYAGLKKPFFSPPNWVFGPVWTLLYFLMGVALYQVWQRGVQKPQVKTALAAFGAQLLLNLTWSLAFFGLRSPSLAFFNIVLLDAAILWTLAEFGKNSRNAALLLVPYALWTLFATVLNAAIWLLNG